MKSSSSRKNKFSCYLIGEDSLADYCIKAILESGYALLGVCSPSGQIRDFANDNGIPYTDSLEVFESWLRTKQCDFLFSVVNSRILSKDIIKLPRCFSINYHNAPLPKYAGVHATSWAILNNEKLYGVTWHIMDEGIDTGDILKQVTFEINAQETNFTLDVKCIEKAVPLFRKLLEELARGRYQRFPQDFGARSYYTLYQKPEDCGVISWQSTAEKIYASYRALSFSGYANKLCLPKFIFSKEVFFAKKIDILPKKRKISSGSIVEITDNYLRVATLTNDIALSQLIDSNGKDYSIVEFVDFYNLKVGAVLPSPNLVFLHKLRQHSELLAKSEAFWVKTLRQIKNVAFWSLGITEESCKGEGKKQTVIYSVARGIIETNVLMTLFLLYLYRLNNYEDFSVGYKSKKEEGQEEDFSPFFSNIVPMNLSFTPNIDFNQALTKVNDLLQLLDKHKTFARDVVLRYPQLAKNILSFSILLGTDKPSEQDLIEMESKLYFMVNDGGITLYHQNNLSTINQQIVANMSGHLQVMVDKLLADKNHPINSISILTKQEQQLILKDWNNTTVPYPREFSIPQIFEEQVTKYPNNVAIKFGDLFLTYEQLNQKANQLAFYLSGLGIKKDSLVATYFDKGINSILSLLSILKAGATYIPIDPMYPNQHIKYILEDTGVFIILTQEKNKKTLEECLPAGKFILLSIDGAKIKKDVFGNGKNRDNLLVNIEPTSLAYIMYTSGSTGAPKGVMINHRAIVRLVKDTNYIQFSPNDIVAQVASMSFDASTFEIWGALLNGAKLVCADSGMLSNVEEFTYFLDNEKVSVMVLVSAVFDKHAAVNSAMFKYLRCLLVGGDVLNVETIHNVVHCSQGSPGCVLNIYGPTENATCTTIFSVPKDFDRNSPIPIGKPIANTTVYVLDKYLNPMPIGIPGELCTGGDGLSLGYWHKKALTKEKFIDTTLNNKKLSLYKIGDLVRWLVDGNLDYICRLDNQVKIRGFRIELEAIELCLLNCNIISQCAVVVKQNKKMDKTLVAYIVVKKRSNDDLSFVRQFLAKHLPPYMIPNVFIILDKLPLTPNGKVDKKLLPLEFQEQISLSENCIHPQTELEHKLADLWKDLLNLDVVSMNDDFFHLGGHSLLITELMVKIKKQIGASFLLSAFLEKPNLANLTQLIEPQHKCISGYKGFDSAIESFIRDTFLDPEIKPVQLMASSVAEKQLAVVLVTGVTGFLGAHLLSDIYRLSDAKIYCLIRASSVDDAYWRLDNVINEYKLTNMIPFDSDRIVVLLGDLTKPLLGLEAKTFEMLSEEVDSVYHCGANVHHLYNYEMLRAANVLSTLEIIKFATNRRNKHIHYVSTLSTAINYIGDHDKNIEDFFSENKLVLKTLNGYAQTKLASEILLTKAHKRGVSVFIYRPSWIIGHTETGVCATENNHLFLFIKGCIQMGVAPKIAAKLNMLPVDFVSNFIIQISLNIGKVKHRVFNIVNSFVVSWSKLFNYINVYGYKTKMISAANWRQEHLIKIDKDGAIYPLVALYLADGGVDWAAEQNNFSNINDAHTKLALKKLKLSYPKINNDLLKKQFDFFSGSGFMLFDKNNKKTNYAANDQPTIEIHSGKHCLKTLRVYMPEYSGITSGYQT